MIIKSRYCEDHGRFCIGFSREPFDGAPGLNELFFDGINEALAGDAIALASWLLFGRFVCRRIQYSLPVSLPLVDQIMKTWGGTLEVHPIDDTPRRFPPRVGSMVLDGGAAEQFARMNEAVVAPVYQFEILPFGASGTSYAGGRVRVKTNAPLLGQGINNPGVGSLLATAILYADFLGVSDLVVSGDLIDGCPPMKVRVKNDIRTAWRELLKHAGFNLRIVG